MIFITARFQVLPEHAEAWPAISREFTEATRAEDGCLWFDWSRSLDDPHEFVLVEAFQDDAAAAHVGSEHFKAAMAWMPDAISATPKIINVRAEGGDWSEMAELQPRSA